MNKYTTLLLLSFLIYSTTGVFTKLASAQLFLSWEYLCYFAMVILVLGVYAVLWQMILKKVPLTQAYLFKSSTVIFSLLFARYLFGEMISFQNVIGCCLIIAGIALNSYQKTV